MKPTLAPLLCSALFFAGFISAQDTRFFRILSSAPTAIANCTPEGYVTWTNAAPDLICTVQTATTLAPGNWSDYVQVPASNYTTTHRLFDPDPAPGMALIPAGSFLMGDALNDTANSVERPIHTVYISMFYVDRYEVTKELWDHVRNRAMTNGYDFPSGLGKAANHPVHSVTWYQCLQWCNARSEQGNLVPVYYTDPALTTIYKTGKVAPFAKWDANGYRLPTEAEWEKAARGGPAGLRFPWLVMTISHSQANYKALNGYPYDLSGPAMYHPAGNDGTFPFTTPVGYFAFNPNGYGLYDVAGNVNEWCWDFFDYGWYSEPAASLPDNRGSAAAPRRIFRGGGWGDFANSSRVAYRMGLDPGMGSSGVGFRCARSAGL